jgi:ABC-2 type transport system ATP-binding protein
MNSILSVENVTKAFDKKLAVNSLSFEVEQGSMFGLLGPNGAGKTTLIRMINQITIPDSGRVLFMGRPIKPEDIEQIGYMPEERGLYPQMKVGEVLVYFAELKGLSKKEAKIRVKRWLEKFEILDWAKKKVNELSKGMQQKIQFIATVIHQPSFLILDEPLSGLDPINANLINLELSEMQKNGTTIMFSTHRMEQVEQICDSIILINHGQKILEGNVNNIKQHYKQNLFKVQFSGDAPASILKQNFKVEKFNKNELIFKLNDGQNPTQLLRFLLDSGVSVTGLQEILPTLNQIFIDSIKQTQD